MHDFAELADRSARINLDALKHTEENVVEALQIDVSSSLVKTLQAVQLGRAIAAVGIFSLFEAILQDRLGCIDGFDGACRCLEDGGEGILLLRFRQFRLAINVLKHGRGRSFDALVEQIGALPFRIKKPDEKFFLEGDVEEISTLIEVDDVFVLGCVEIIRNVSNFIVQRREDVIL